MVTRRAVVTAGALGALSATGVDAAGRDAAQSPDQQTAVFLGQMHRELREIKTLLEQGLVGPTVGHGEAIGALRRQFGLFLRSNQKFPDYCEVGSAVFTDVYDWHVRYGQSLEVARPENRTALRFMFTWLILRTDQDPAYVGIPYDRA